MIPTRVAVPKKLFCALLVPIGLLTLFTAGVQLPGNVLHPSADAVGVAGVLTEAFPQGWAFFIRTPREEQHRVYAVRGDRLVSLDRGPFSQLGNVAGLDRTSRRQGPELAFILRQVAAGDWSRCLEPDDDCLRVAPAAIAVRNPEPNPTYCGPVLVLGRDIVPWGYRNLVAGPTVNSRDVRLDVHCE